MKRDFLSVCLHQSRTFFGTTQFRINGTSFLNIIILLWGKAGGRGGGGGIKYWLDGQLGTNADSIYPF